MVLNIYIVNAFVSDLMKGNPACVVQLDSWPSDNFMLKMAKENALPETAFFIINDFEVSLRWFTPEIEIDLCGHATLATAYIIKEVLNFSLDRFVFKTMSGILKVNYKQGLYFLNLPSRNPVKAILPKQIELALSIKPVEVFKSRDYMLVYNKQKDVENIVINRNYFDKINLGFGGVIITSKGDEVDFVSRFFTPQASILEDPVTGSAHCTLVPYWSTQLLKNKMVALQLSKRGGEIFCENFFDRVIISGKAQISSNSKIHL
tara:strand:- start:335 stop:1120 length:786 start_codon:yes stop_codon:yes gene_type:complete